MPHASALSQPDTQSPPPQRERRARLTFFSVRPSPETFVSPSEIFVAKQWTIDSRSIAPGDASSDSPGPRALTNTTRSRRTDWILCPLASVHLSGVRSGVGFV